MAFFLLAWVYLTLLMQLKSCLLAGFVLMKFIDLNILNPVLLFFVIRPYNCPPRVCQSVCHLIWTLYLSHLSANSSNFHTRSLAPQVRAWLFSDRCSPKWPPHLSVCIFAHIFFNYNLLLVYPLFYFQNKIAFCYLIIWKKCVLPNKFNCLKAYVLVYKDYGTDDIMPKSI